MKKPSRYMPKYGEMARKLRADSLKERIYYAIEISLCWGLLLGIMIFLYQHLQLMIPVVLIISMFVLYSFKNGKTNNAHFEKLLKNRPNESICTFSRHFDCREVDTWVIRAVYEELQTMINRGDFPISPADDVFADLLLDGDDFDLDLIEQVAERTGRSWKGYKENPYFGKANIVENLVYFFNHQPLVNAE